MRDLNVIKRMEKNECKLSICYEKLSFVWRYLSYDVTSVDFTQYGCVHCTAQ